MKHLLLTTIAAVVLVGCGESSIRIEDAILSADPPARNIWQAAADGEIDAVKYHLAAGVDVNAPDVIKRTPLAYAASEGHKEIVELLIAKSAVFRADKN
jgi:ankyrin repeat protein